MPQVFKLGSYWVYFWTNEGKPLEPIHVHISQGSPTEHSTKVWITSAGKTLLANNNSHIPERLLRNMMRIIEHWELNACHWHAASPSRAFFY